MRRRNVAIAECALSTQSHPLKLMRYRQHKVIAISPTIQLILNCLLFSIASASILRTHHG